MKEEVGPDWSSHFQRPSDYPDQETQGISELKIKCLYLEDATKNWVVH